MRIMLINSAIQVYLRMPSVPLGLISIGSYLRAHGDEVVLVDRSLKKCDIVKEIENFKPQFIGISCMSFYGCLDAKTVTKQIHEVCDVPVVWGGQSPSSLPELCLREGKPDYISIGEGEITIYELAHSIENKGDVSKIKGLAYLDKKGNFIRTEERPVADLTTFPEMDWSFVEPQKYFSSFFLCNKMLYVHSSKGCTASCTFCPNKYFHQGRNMCRDPKHVMHDIEYLVGKCGANGIYFSDELFMPNRRIRNELLSMIIDSKLDFVWGCQMRLGVLNNEDIDYMYKAGCRWILFGIESGSPDMLRRIKKGIDLHLAEPTIGYCKKIGITVQASFIIGFPDETPEELQKTIDLALSLPASLPTLNILMPMPNSEIYYHQVETNPNFHEPKRLKEVVKWETEITDSAKNNLSKISKKDLYVVHYFFQWRDFSGKDSVRGDKYGVAKKLARDAFIRIFKHGFKGFFYGTYRSARQFLTVWFFSHFFPKTLKKYGLKK